MKHTIWVAVLALVPVVAGCRRDTDERLGLDERRVAAFDPNALARPGELEKALAQPAADVARKLGPYRLRQTAKMEIERAERKGSLEETWRMEVDAKGAVALLHENDHGYGLETYADGASIWVRPRYGKFVRRPAEGDEVDRARNQQEGVLAGYLAVLGRFAARRDDGAVTVDGRAARKIALSLAPSPTPETDTDPAHAWRHGMRVSALDGEVVVDAASGAPLRAKLAASYAAPRLSETGVATADDMVSVKLAYESSVDEVGAVAAIVPPADALPAPARTRPLVDRQQLLDGLVAGGRP